MDSINSSPPERAARGFHPRGLLGVFGALSLLSRVRHTNEPRRSAPRLPGRLLASEHRGGRARPGRVAGGCRWARISLQGRGSCAAPSPHFHLQPVPACVGEGSIYSALFLAPSSEEPDSQLMTGTRRGVSAALWSAHARRRCAEAQGCCS